MSNNHFTNAVLIIDLHIIKLLNYKLTKPTLKMHSYQ